MDELGFLSSTPPPSSSSSSTISKTNSIQRQRTDSASVIQQADVSSSRPALLAHDALGPLLFEALDGFFFTINHNLELDFVSDNVGQYLKYSQEELTGRNLYHCVHPSDVAEFSKAWMKKDAGDSLDPPSNAEQSRGRTFLCRMRTNDESTPYTDMLVSVALHRDSSGSDKTFLICIARRPPVNESRDTPTLLGFDQFSSRVNLQFDIENFDVSHIKCETFDTNYQGKKFRDYVHPTDIPVIIRHFQEVIEKGEAISSVYRFCLHDDVYAFVNSHSRLFPNSLNESADSIVSTHTIVRLIENPTDLNGNASTRLMKSIIASNRDLQKNKPSSSTASTSTATGNKLLPPSRTSTPPIGTQFALAMFGMHKNPSNSLQQHVSNTIGTLFHVQSSFSSPTSTENEKNLQQIDLNLQKTSTFDTVSSSETVEFGSKRTACFSPTFGSISSPVNSLDVFLPSLSPSNDLSSFLPSPSPLSTQKKSSSPLEMSDGNGNFFPSNENYSAVSNQSTRTSLRLRQLLATKSPTSPSQTIHYQQNLKSQSSHFDDLTKTIESPTTTNTSPSAIEPSNRRLRKASQTNGTTTPTPQSSDALLKQILGRQADSSDNTNHFTRQSAVKIESNVNDENTSNSSDGASIKLRSDAFLRTLLNDEIRQQKVMVEAPFSYGARLKTGQRASGGSTDLLGNNQNKPPGRSSFKSQFSLDINETAAVWEKKSAPQKKQRQYSHTYGSRNNSMTVVAGPAKKNARAKRETTDYLLSNPPQSNLSEHSLDSFFDFERGTSEQQSSIVLPRTTAMTNNLKRSADQDESFGNARKYPRLLAQVLKEDIKIESTDQSIISPSAALAATRPLNTSQQTIIKTEPDLFDLNPPVKRTTVSTGNSLLRSLIRTPQAPKKDAPLYDLLQNLDANDTSIFTTMNSIDNSQATKPTSNASIDPLEQYLSPVGSTKSSSAKDDYLAALLNADPQRPSEIAFVPLQKQQSNSNLARSTSTSSETNRIAAIVNDLFDTTTTTTTTTNINDDFISLLDNKEFLECLNDPSTVDLILADTPVNLLPTSQTPTNPKQSEKDEKAISEIYKTLVTSFNPGPSTLDLPVDNSPFSSLSGDFLFTDTTPNRTVNMDPIMTTYRQQPNTYAYQSTQQQQQSSSNTSQYSDCLPMDMIDSLNAFPPNVTLSPMNNSFLPSNSNNHMDNNSSMMFSQSMSNQMQHHQTSNQINAHFYRQPSQNQTTPMYNNYLSGAPPPPPNQVAPSYYSMQQQTPASQGHPSMGRSSPMNKRAALMHAQRASQQNNQQLQLHMQMNVTLPHMQSNQQQQQHRPIMNTYNDMMMNNGNSTPMQQDFHPYSSSTPMSGTNSMDLGYGHDLFMSPSPAPSQQQRQMNMMQQQQQPYSNMNVALPTTTQQQQQQQSNINSSSMSNLTPIECRQSDELNNQMMNCLSFHPARCTSEFVRKQLQNTIQGRQKPAANKDMSAAMSGQKMINPGNLDSNQKGAYFRTQLSSPISTPPLPNTSIRSHQQQQQHYLHQQK